MLRILVTSPGRSARSRRRAHRAGSTPRRWLAILAPEAGTIQKHVPSVDRLLVSVSHALGARACGVVLTGMGQDGRAGIAAIKRGGGLTLAESQETAVIYGMPQAAAESGALDELLPLDGLADRIARFGRGM